MEDIKVFKIQKDRKCMIHKTQESMIELSYILIIVRLGYCWRYRSDMSTPQKSVRKAYTVGKKHTRFFRRISPLFCISDMTTNFVHVL